MSPPPAIIVIYQYSDLRKANGVNKVLPLSLYRLLRVRDYTAHILPHALRGGDIAYDMVANPV